MTTHQASCHCGGVRFEFTTDLSAPMECNCSFCARRGAVLHRVDDKDVNVIQGEELLSKYGNREFSDHFFCSRCGIHCFTRINFSGTSYHNVNVRCAPDIDVAALAPRMFDGANQL